MSRTNPFGPQEIDPEVVARAVMEHTVLGSLAAKPMPAAAADRPAPARHVVAIASGKGGVGKSTVSLNLALALRERGFMVGLLDADVYGPDIPLMVNLTRKTRRKEWTFWQNPKEGRIVLEPVRRFSLEIMSVGFLLAEDQAVTWSSQLVHVLVRQLLEDVSWGDLDFMVVNLPPRHGRPSAAADRAAPARRRDRRRRSAGRRASRRKEGARDVRRGKRPRAGRGREHDPARLPPLREADRRLPAGAGRALDLFERGRGDRSHPGRSRDLTRRRSRAARPRRGTDERSRERVSRDRAPHGIRARRSTVISA
jgi:hypothetical protein